MRRGGFPLLPSQQSRARAKSLGFVSSLRPRKRKSERVQPCLLWGFSWLLLLLACAPLIDPMPPIMAPNHAPVSIPTLLCRGMRPPVAPQSVWAPRMTGMVAGAQNHHPHWHHHPPFPNHGRSNPIPNPTPNPNHAIGRHQQQPRQQAEQAPGQAGRSRLALASKGARRSSGGGKRPEQRKARRPGCCITRQSRLRAGVRVSARARGGTERGQGA